MKYQRLQEKKLSVNHFITVTAIALKKS